MNVPATPAPNAVTAPQRRIRPLVGLRATDRPVAVDR